MRNACVGLLQVGWVFTVLFYVVWNFVFVGIVTGQIVTAFSVIRATLKTSNAIYSGFNAEFNADLTLIQPTQAIRERETFLSKNEAEHCLVCSIDRFTLERHGLAYEEHVTEVHSPWGYTCFMVRLASMRFDERNGMESYVASKLEVPSTGGWII